MLQADKAKRSAEIARLTYEATLRDVRAQTETACYQILLDGALADVQAETVHNLDQVLKVPKFRIRPTRLRRRTSSARSSTSPRPAKTNINCERLS
jgi:hypothetical protein